MLRLEMWQIVFILTLLAPVRTKGQTLTLYRDAFTDGQFNKNNTLFQIFLKKCIFP